MTDPDSPRVLVTGATGFVGRHVVSALESRRYPVRRALRTEAHPRGGDDVVVGDIGERPDWGRAVDGVGAVVHLAARVHRRAGSAGEAEAAYERENVEATRSLAEAAARAGVERMIFVSTVKVLGESSPPGGAFDDRSEPRPLGPYARSKRAAEVALAGVPGLEVMTLRPPLVFGPGVGANFHRLLTAVDRGLPLPLGAVTNRRSLVYVENLADLVAESIGHRVSGTFLVADRPALSTAGLVRALAAALGRPARLVPLPPGLLRRAAGLLGRGEEIDRLTGSLEVDDAAVRGLTGWAPPVELGEAIARTCEWYRRREAP